MARRSTSNSYRGASLPPLDLFSADRILRSLSPLIAFEDRRLWHPEGPAAPARALPRAAARITAPALTTPASKPYKMTFAAPAGVAICVRRKTRKEVLFAKKRTKKGSGSSKRKNFYSRIGC